MPTPYTKPLLCVQIAGSSLLYCEMHDHAALGTSCSTPTAVLDVVFTPVGLSGLGVKLNV